MIWREDHFAGGAGLNRGGSLAGDDLATGGRDIADDLAAIKPTAAASPTATNLAEVITLAEELRTINDASAAVVLKTIKAT